MKRSGKTTRWMIIALMMLPVLLSAQGRSSVSLDGDWTFALDPVKVGEAEAWYRPEVPFGTFDKVVVPHCLSVDKRYEFYTGKAWYFKKFGAGGTAVGAGAAGSGGGGAAAGMRQFLRFEAVFYRARVWLNGELVGAHEGGYTPFEIDVTNKVKAENVLSVETDNSWDTTTLPGAKTLSSYPAIHNAQVYPWINYGGITRPVSLVTRPVVYIKAVKVVTDPDLKKGTAKVMVRAMVRNLSGSAVKVNLAGRIYREAGTPPVTGLLKARSLDVAAGTDAVVSFETVLPAAQVALWDQDHCNLYKAEIVMGADTAAAGFGIRKLELKNNQLLLNGEPIRMGGANRPLDHPDYGSMDPAVVLDKDLTLMKDGCMELSRINHYPVPEYLLDWADKHGLLVIEEAGNWQMTDKQMADTMMRRKWQSQMREMVERDWNHPSIMAWSVGNEFPSASESGKAWVRDMRAYTLGIDSSRFITFASMFVARDMIKAPEDEASQYVDFISANIYGGYLKGIQHIHEIYPNKAIFLSEFGIRADQVKDESERVAHLKNAMAAFRQCDYLIGACVWTFQDYRSRFPGSNANGYRPWGLISPNRETRGMYTTWQEEFAPAVVEKTSSTTVRVTARKDFPSYTLRDYTLACNGRSLPLKVLKPGESQELTVEGLGQSGAATEVSLVKPGGFVVLKKNL